MALVKVTRILDRDRAIERLIHLRQEWQEAAGAASLSEVSAPVGLLLVDVVIALELLPEEAERVLGQGEFLEPAPMILPLFAEAE